MIQYEDLDSPAAALGALQRYNFIRTGVEPGHDGVPWMGRPVFLVPQDRFCDGCGDLIDPDEWYGEAWANVLGRQKLKHGGTWCGDCFTDRDQPEESNESERAGRTFD